MHLSKQLLIILFNFTYTFVQTAFHTQIFINTTINNNNNNKNKNKRFINFIIILKNMKILLIYLDNHV